ncbi:TetR/AcrR family transcriptional regulator [Actinoplanes friuliensis]|uniref:TetR family transcriptional regulator n=1 Tax=Actinoplanes friuliensis DSM 7358 TaxID=1246995 RepID=U5W5R2_9ACTN|nr:TetR/AcrR family transcriptional regulator [Actinoplanes friuliensis]AGZ43330.1 TetR family transcriptional regulator [Actinoplanes friuliensis DSM 7358]
MAGTRRRGTELEQAILRAAADELVASGYRGFAMDAVARRAGTNKNTIYRRWPSRAALGVAAYRELSEAALQPADTGDLRADALDLLRRVNGDATSPRAEILRSLLAGLADDPELLTEMHEQIADGSTGSWLILLERAVARGQARPGALHPRVATVAITLLRNEYLTRGLSAVPDNTLVEIVDEVFLPLVRQQG